MFYSNKISLKDSNTSFDSFAQKVLGTTKTASLKEEVAAVKEEIKGIKSVAKDKVTARNTIFLNIPSA